MRYWPIPLIRSPTPKIGLIECFGTLFAASETYDFDFTSYYEAEMGAGLHKQLVCFKQRIDPAELATVKAQTMELERAMSQEGIAGGPISTQDCCQSRAWCWPQLSALATGCALPRNSTPR